MQNINIIISNISTITITNTGVRTGTYFFEDNDEKKVVGKMTNEAPIVLLEEKLKSRGETLSKMMFIASEKVRNPITDDIQNRERNLLCVENELKELKKTDLNPKEVTHLNLLQYYLEQHLGKTIDDVMEVFEIKDKPQRKDVVSVVYKIKDYIEGLTQNPETKVNIYVEANGGVRYVAFMLINVLQLLEKNDPNHIEIQSVYNMVYSQEDKLTRISDTLNIYQSVELVSATDEFLMYGRTASLKRYFEDVLESTKDFKGKQDINKCLASLENLEDDIQLCRTDGIYNGITKSLELIQNFLKKYDDTDDDNENENVIIFYNICKDIKNEMENNGLNVSEPSNNSMINVIAWLNNKGFIQQALTMCAEKLPRVFFEEGYLKFTSETIDQSYRKIQGRSLTDYYKWLFSDLNGLRKPSLEKRLADNQVLEKIAIQEYIAQINPKENAEISIGTKLLCADEILDKDDISLSKCVEKIRKVVAKNGKIEDDDDATYFGKFTKDIREIIKVYPDNSLKRPVIQTESINFAWLCGKGNSPDDYQNYDLDYRKALLLHHFGSHSYFKRFDEIYTRRKDVKNKNKANKAIDEYIEKAPAELRERLLHEKILTNNTHDDNERISIDNKRRNRERVAKIIATFFGTKSVFDCFKASLVSHFFHLPSNQLIGDMLKIINEKTCDHHISYNHVLKKLKTTGTKCEYTALMDVGNELTTDYPNSKQELADIFYLYSFLNKQRNMANHASDQENIILLNSAKTQAMINLIIDRMKAIRQQ